MYTTSRFNIAILSFFIMHLSCIPSSFAKESANHHHTDSSAQPIDSTPATPEDEHNDKHTDEQGSDDHHHEHDGDVETIQITSTRSRRTQSDEPVKVEVIVREELEEKAIMRPGNISMLVAETGGVRVQTTSPALGSANIRLQGLYGRYTQLLSDGLPLYGGQAASIGLLQIPPTDLASVEIIKGSASSLYGGSAMGGVINLISRRPSDEFEGEVLLNATSRDGQDITTYLAAPVSDSMGLSFTAGGHHQGRQDFDRDGWIDMAGYERYTARPRLFWENENGTRVYATAGYMTENRDGGTLENALLPDASPFPHDQNSERVDSGLIASGSVNETMNWQARASAMTQKHVKQFGVVSENDKHESYLIEGTLSGDTAHSHWLLGVAMQSERFKSDDFSQFSYRFNVPGIFAQLDYDIFDDFSTSISTRFDDHSEFGTQFSPRISVLYRPNDWTVRASYGRGYFAPTPFVEDIEAAGLSRLATLADLDEERAITSSLDVGYQFGKFESNVTIFSSSVEGVTQLEAFASRLGEDLDRVRLVNGEGDSRILGSELALRYKWQDIKLTASYLFLDATQLAQNTNHRQRINLTPRHSLGFVAMWEQHGKFRVGFEAYYTGTQSLEGNPYRTESDAYWHLGLMGEKTFGQFSWFINLENLLNIRQTKEDSLVLLERAPSGRWTTDIWSRNDGFIVNAGVRIRFGGH